MRSPHRRLVFAATAALVAFAPSLHAQSMMRPPVRWDLTLGNGEGVTSVSLGAVRLRDVFPGNRLRVGLGLRTTFVTGEQRLTPAGAKNVPPGVIDTLTVKAAAFMLNVAGHVGVVLTSRLDVGLNIDLAGVGFGASRDATYRASAGASATAVDASPATGNLFLYGSNDRGSLNSEFFVSWKARDRITLRGGLSHQLTEYKAERVLTSNTDRFRHYSNLIFVGARLTR